MKVPHLITPETLHRRIVAGDPPLVLDVLPEEAFEERHLPNAKNACVYETGFLEKAKTFTAGIPTTPIVVYGEEDSFAAAEEAARQLERAGYTGVTVLQGGVSSWRAAGFELEGGGPVSVSIADGGYALEPGSSVVDWVGRNLGNKHWGTLRISSGELTFAEGGLAEGKAVIDMNSMACTDLTDARLNQMLLDHLKSSDFFETASYPATVVQIISVAPIPAARPGIPNTRFTARLTLRGVTQELSFDGIAGLTADRRFVIQASFELDRTRWNVRYGSARFFERLGKHLVNDLIGVQIKIVAPVELRRG